MSICTRQQKPNPSCDSVSLYNIGDRRVPATVVRFNYKIIVQFPNSAGRLYSYVMQMLYTYAYVDSYDNIDVCIPTDINEFCVFTSTYNGVDPPVKGIAKKNC
jgi:hypothetical protein